ncbi:MAG: hypothetical protein HY787_14715 [Deltaproteobacteria bacterium]|nr:hypothetical protein [Deltaproteobacteria bacterium]
MGSLIEREFSYRLIKAVMNIPEEELLRRLSFLKDAELLYERGLFPDSTFIFKHALTREVVYDTLLEKRKKELHLDIGKAIEKVYKDNLEEMYSTLAEHFEKGGDYEKAATHFNLAQARALSKSANLDAIAFSRKEVACLEKLPITVEMQKRVIDARVTLANNCMMIIHYVEAKDAVAPIIGLVRELDYHQHLPAIYIIMAGYLSQVEERPEDSETRRYLIEAQKLALEEKNYRALGGAFNQEGISHSCNCEFVDGESCFLRLLELSEASGVLIGRVMARSNLAALIYALDGRIDKALKCGQEALDLALQADDVYLKGAAYWACGIAFFRKGLFPETEKNLTLTIEMSEAPPAERVASGSPPRGGLGLGKVPQDLLIIFQN